MNILQFINKANIDDNLFKRSEMVNLDKSGGVVWRFRRTLYTNQFWESVAGSTQSFTTIAQQIICVNSLEVES